MRSRAFAVVMGVACAALAILCVGLASQVWTWYQRREALPRAVALYQEGDFEGALPHLERALAIEPDRTDLCHLAASICLRLKRFDQARDYYARYRDRTDGVERARAELRLALIALEGASGAADLVTAIGHLGAARNEFDEAKAPGDVALTLLLLADAYRRQGDATSAEGCLVQLEALPASARGGAPEPIVAMRQVAAKIRKGDVPGLAEAWEALRGQQGAETAAPRQAVALALALRAGDPALPEPLRRICVAAMEDLSAPAKKTYALRLLLNTANAWGALGDQGLAVAAVRKALELAPKDATTLRTYASVLFAAAAQAANPATQATLREQGLKAWRDFLAEAKVPPQDQRQVSLALATRAWNEGRRAEAQQLLASFGAPDSPLVARMAAVTALDKHDYLTAIKHLRRIEQLEGASPQVTALLAQFATPPEVLGLRVSRLHPYDARPILIAAFTPRAVGAEIAPESVSATLDGSPAQPVVTRAELFLRPDQDLAPGDHKVEVALADSLGLKAARSLPFAIEVDKDPPTIVGITPEPNGRTPDFAPVVSFRCTDPSGIVASSLSVVFGPAGDEGPRRRDLTIVSEGVYQVDIRGSTVKIARGSRVERGVVTFQPSQALAPGAYRVKVSVEDMRGNRGTREWVFECNR